MDLNRRRAEKLKLDIFESGCKDKLKAVVRICIEKKIPLENVCYIGDDINDIDVINAVGYGCCPADAIAEIREISDYTAIKKGGDGVIREVASRIISSMSTLTSK